MSTYTTRMGNIVIEVPTHTNVHPAWRGFRFTDEGRYFVAPDGQHITQERMRGILWRDEMELRRAGHQSRRKALKAPRAGSTVKVVIVDLADWQEHHLGRRAG